MFAVAFGALSQAGVRWCLLRGADDLADGDGDADILLAPDDVAAADAVLTRAGFSPLPVAGGRHRHVFHAFDPASGAWLRIDAVTRLGLGRHGHLPVEATAECLAEAVADGDLRFPHAHDAFWLLLGHCFLEKNQPPAHHRAALADLAACATDAGRLAGIIAARLGRPPGALRRLAAAADWDGLVAAARPARQRGRRSPRGAARTLAHRLGTGSTALVIARRRRGVAVLLTGEDAAARTALAGVLADRLPLAVRHRPATPGLVATSRLHVTTAIDVGRGRIVVVDGTPRAAHAIVGRGRGPLASALVVVLMPLHDPPPPGAVAIDTRRPPDEIATELAGLVWDRCTAGWSPGGPGRRRGSR